MKKHFLLISILSVFLFSSCNKESINDATHNTTTEIRTNNSISFSITLANQSVVNLSGTAFTAAYTSGSQFSITVYHTSNSPQTYTGISATITDSESRMELTTDPGFSEVVYQHMSTLNITADTVNRLNLAMDPGNIATTSTSVNGEEEDGL